MEKGSAQRGRATHLSRRHFLAGATTVLGGLMAGSYVARGTALSHRFTTSPFTLGVASGDPWPTSVVLWTRLAPDPLHDGGMPPYDMPVQWRVATDERMRHVVQRGTVWAQPALAHTVHMTVYGLEPARWYWYQFSVDAADSPIGRTRTAPVHHAQVDHLALAFASCADWQNGLYAAYGAMAKEDLDLVVHLGDYLYEYDPIPDAIRQHEGPKPCTLGDYRNRHALYKTDPQLQAAHQAFPWVVVWDDHEVENNYANMWSERTTEDPQTFLQRRAAAYQAYYEHMPLRSMAMPIGPDMRLYRRLRFGTLVEFHVLDTRQYRTDQPCDDGVKPRCAAAFDPSATMLGAVQEHWLYEGLAQAQTRWQVLAQQTMLAQFDFFPDVLLGAGAEGFNLDQWDGYVAARQRLLTFLQQRRLANLVVVTGDIHASFVHEIKANFDDPDSATLGTEFVGPSITSDFPAGFVSGVHQAVAENPHTHFFDGVHHGYVRCTLDTHQWQADYRVVPTVQGLVRVHDAEASTLASFVVLDAQPGVVAM